jgi:cell filamentation protein
MQSLEDEEWLQGLGKEEFIERLAHYYCEINVLHPISYWQWHCPADFL